MWKLFRGANVGNRQHEQDRPLCFSSTKKLSLLSRFLRFLLLRLLSPAFREEAFTPFSHKSTIVYYLEIDDCSILRYTLSVSHWCLVGPWASRSMIVTINKTFTKVPLSPCSILCHTATTPQSPTKCKTTSTLGRLACVPIDDSQQWGYRKDWEFSSTNVRVKAILLRELDVRLDREFSATHQLFCLSMGENNHIKALHWQTCLLWLTLIYIQNIRTGAGQFFYRSLSLVINK